MELKNSKKREYKEYVLELSPEEEQLLIEIASKQILDDREECINYAVKCLLSDFMGDEKIKR